MTAILDQTISRAVKLKYIPSGEAEAVKNRILQMSAKYGFSPDDFAMFTFIESDGMDPKAWNGSCAGIIQFCQDNGAATVGYSNAEEIRRLSVLQQLDLTDKYFAANNLKKGADLSELYLTVLNPASREVKDPNADLGVPGQQAQILYDRPRVITRNSINKAIKELSAQKLNTSVANLPNSSSIPGDYNQSKSNLGSSLSAIKSGLFNGENCPPPPYTQQARIIYTGCKSVISSASFSGGMGMGYAAPGIAAIGNSSTSSNIAPYTGALNPGGFIKPANAPVNSPYGMRWGRMHNGIDIAAEKGTPIVAAADGKVIYLVTGCTLENTGQRSSDECGGGGYGNSLELEHGGGFATFYAHASEILVKSGEIVKQGQVIAKMGSTGSSTGPHIHFEMKKAGQRVNPADYIKNL